MNLEELAKRVYAAAGRKDVRQAVERIYADLQLQIDARRPLCNSSGRCCRFEEFGHRLYVTTMELAAFVYELETRSWPPTLDEARQKWDSQGCPFQVAGLCGVHGIRPFGCRVFFCDSTSDLWQHEQYEKHHAELKRLHEVLEVPYFYVEWRSALRALGLTREIPQSPRIAMRGL